jgi:hypothetical protein
MYYRVRRNPAEEWGNWRKVQERMYVWLDRIEVEFSSEAPSCNALWPVESASRDGFSEDHRFNGYRPYCKLSPGHDEPHKVTTTLKRPMTWTDTYDG